MLGRGGILLCPRGFPAVTVRLKLRDGAAKSPCTCGLDSEIYNNIAAKCDKETMLQREYTSDCMDKRNRYMVDHADYILAVWNGCPSGTGNTVRYAHKKGKSIIVINPVSLDVTRE